MPEDLVDQIPTALDIHLFKETEDTQLEDEAKKRGATSLKNLTYKHFQHEMNLINSAFYEVMTEGDKTGQPFTFPNVQV